MISRMVSSDLTFFFIVFLTYSVGILKLSDNPENVSILTD